MNMATITNPSMLMLMFSNQFQNEPERFELRSDQSAELDRADDRRDRDRESRDRDVVEDLADRLENAQP